MPSSNTHVNRRDAFTINDSFRVCLDQRGSESHEREEVRGSHSAAGKVSSDSFILDVKESLS